MAFRYVPCPRCESSNGYLLSEDATNHLRQCVECDLWFVVETDRAGDETEVTTESLGDPATCPVDGCEETFVGDELPQHVIERHDRSLHPDD